MSDGALVQRTTNYKFKKANQSEGNHHSIPFVNGTLWPEETIPSLFSYRLRLIYDDQFPFQYIQWAVIIRGVKASLQ